MTDYKTSVKIIVLTSTSGCFHSDNVDLRQYLHLFNFSMANSKVTFQFSLFSLL
jgi:hypothetical protein